ncbi:MAG: hypothetical protein AAFY72_14535 [Cyanobacteria bacterium J06649_4]
MVDSALVDAWQALNRQPVTIATVMQQLKNQAHQYEGPGFLTY